MLAVIVIGCAASGLMVSKPKTEIMYFQTKCGEDMAFTVAVAGQVHKRWTLCTWAGQSV